MLVNYVQLTIGYDVAKAIRIDTIHIEGVKGTNADADHYCLKEAEEANYD